MQKIDNITKDLNESNKGKPKALASLEKEYNKLASKQKKFLDSIDDTLSQVKSNDNIKSDKGTIVSDKLQKDIGSKGKLSGPEIKAKQIELDAFKVIIKDTDDKSEQKDLEKLVKLQQSLLNQSKKDNSIANSFIGDKLDDVAGVITGVFSESPLIGVLTAGAVNATKKFFADRKDKKDIAAQSLRDTSNTLDALNNVSSVVQSTVSNSPLIDAVNNSSESSLIVEKEKMNNTAIKDDKNIELQREAGVKQQRQEGIFSKMLKQLEIISGVSSKILKKDDDNSLLGGAIAGAIAGGMAKSLKSLLGKTSKGVNIPKGSLDSKKPIPQITAPVSGMLANFKAMMTTFGVAIAANSKVFIKKAGSLLSKLNPFLAIGLALATGFDNAIAKFAETGDISKSLGQLFGGILEFFTFGLIKPDQVEKILDPIFEGIGKAITGLFDALTYIPSQIIKLFSGETNFTKIFEDLSSKVNTIMDAISSLSFDSVLNGIKKGATFITDLLGVTEWFTRVGVSLSKVALDNGITKKIDSFQKSIGDFFDMIKSKWDTLIKSFTEFSITDFIMGKNDDISNTRDSSGVISGLTNSFSDFFNKKGTHPSEVIKDRTNDIFSSAKKPLIQNNMNNMLSRSIDNHKQLKNDKAVENNVAIGGSSNTNNNVQHIYATPNASNGGLLVRKE